MTLRRWDVVFVRADDQDQVGHPGVVLSPEELLRDPRHERFNVVIGSKKSPAFPQSSRHVALNGAEGLELQTLVDCSLVVMARKRSVLRRVGTVGLERRGEIKRKIRSYLGLG